MLNPYEKEAIVEGEMSISRGFSCALIAIFVL